MNGFYGAATRTLPAQDGQKMSGAAGTLDTIITGHK